MLLHRGLSDRGHRQVLPGPCQPHQDPAIPRTGTVRGLLRQGKPANKVNGFFQNSDKGIILEKMHS